MKYRFDSAMDSPDLNSEPHFDDERTLLSARPVVPLEKLNAKVRHRRQWFLGGAFAIAMMLGAASALLASYLKMRNVQPVAVEVTQESSPADEPAETVAAVADNPPAETPVAEVEETSDTEGLIPIENAPKKHTAVKRRIEVSPRHDDDVIESSDDRKMSEEDQLNRIREAVLVDEWQERRARRVWRRERRRAERYNNHRDLSNLDEIFEGRKRPNP